MCYTSEVSMISFITSLFCCILLYIYGQYISNNNFKIIALAALFIGLMQIYDYIFWNNQSKNNINKIFTKIALASNNLQPIILALLIIIYTNKIGNFSKVMTIVYTICAIIYSIYCWNKADYTLVNNVSSPGLFWIWNNLKYNTLFYTLFVITLILLFIENFSFPFNIILAIIYIITFIMSQYYNKQRATGRFWCYFSAFIPLLIVISTLIYNFLNK